MLRLIGNPIGMLDAILTNEVPKSGSVGAYAALLNPKGRIQTDLRVLKWGEDILVDTEPEGADPAREILGRYAPFSRVLVEDLSADVAPWGILGLYGPRAGNLLGNLNLAEHETTEIEVGEETLLVTGVAVPVPGFDLIGPVDTLRAAMKHLTLAGAVTAGLSAHETARVAAGIPRFGADIAPDNFPGECDLLNRAVSFEKGCYPGQETVARMRYRGHPNRTLHRFILGGPPPTPETSITQGERPVGRITSVAPLPAGGNVLALGYLHRSADPAGDLRAGDATVHLKGSS